MKYFVYHNDDYEDCGGVGLEEFSAEKDALEFIQQRLAYVDKPNIDNYTLIRGHKMNLKVVEVATQFQAER